jgi:chromosome segregation ATPase
MGGLTAKNLNEKGNDVFPVSDSMVTKRIEPKTDAISLDIPEMPTGNFGDNEKTVAVAGYVRNNDGNYDDRVKVSVGQNRPASSGYAVWGSSGSAESNLAQADNLRIAQEKIIDLESENEKLRLQNEELMSASEIIKERSDLLSAQLSEYKNDRENLEESFKNEIVLLKNHLAKKDSELQKAVLKSDELESRLKFDMKKIRVRERELENRLELIRAEKNAVVKNKDEQILDLRRKMDVLQMEVESYRQKCLELNKLIETNQESFKRTTRALRLAMANLELQEENKVPMKKAE